MVTCTKTGRSLDYSYRKLKCRCDDCRAENTRRLQVYRKTDIGKKQVRRANLRASFGITSERYEELLVQQNGVCASCFKPETGMNQYGVLPLAVDHDHTTNEIRGLLCMRCNRALGLLQDSQQIVSQLLEYRKKFR